MVSMEVLSAYAAPLKPVGDTGGEPQVIAVMAGSMLVGTKNSQNDESAALWPLSNGKLA